MKYYSSGKEGNRKGYDSEGDKKVEIGQHSLTQKRLFPHKGHSANELVQR